MVYNDPDPTDPNVLVGVVLPADGEAMREMAYAFAEEFARMGHDRQQILALFKNPFYGGAHGAYRALGEEAIQSIVDECLGAWGQVKFSILDFGREPQSNDFGLPIEGTGGIENLKSKIQNGGGVR